MAQTPENRKKREDDSVFSFLYQKQTPAPESESGMEQTDSAKKKDRSGWIRLAVPAVCLFLAVLLVVLVPSSLMTGCLGAPVLTKQTFTFELGSDVYANPRVYIENPDREDAQEMEITAVTPGIQRTENRFVSTGKDYLQIGEYDFMLVDGSREIPFKIKVKDTQPPKIMNPVSSVDAALGSTIDWASVLQGVDLSDVYYEAPRDVTSAAGEQEITVKVLDRFGNSTDKQITVNVQ